MVRIRRELEARKYAETGAGAILWALEKLGYRPLPSIPTINRILKEQGLVKRRAPYTPKGKVYPQPPATEPNALHQADRLGPRYLTGDGCFTR